MTKTKSLLKGIGNYVATTKYYDEWSSNYDMALHKWNYRAPSKAALILKKYLTKKPDYILDLACGTGLFAQEILKFYPKTTIDGIDISKKILKEASKKNIYRKLYSGNFDFKIPINYEYDLVSCIGALTYSKKPKKLILSICDSVKKDCTFIFTHRLDLWEKQKYDIILKEISNKWKIIFISRPILYLPKNYNFGKKIKIRFVVLKKR